MKQCISKFSEDQEGLHCAHNFHHENGKLKVQHSRGTQLRQQADFKENGASVMPYIAKRMNKNSDVSAIMKLSRSAVSPVVYAALQQCQPTGASVERLFSMLNKLLDKDRNFL